MPESSSEKLYSPTLLGLAASLAEFPLEGSFNLTADARSRTCGSTISIGLNTDMTGTVTRIGMQVSACAVGQSSAALLAQGARGKSPYDLIVAHGEVESWLKGESDLPDWPDFDALKPALPHRGRHSALLLPWNAALRALSSGNISG